jgi:thiol-disulfide isomerase/thioredoxin
MVGCCVFLLVIIGEGYPARTGYAAGQDQVGQNPTIVEGQVFDSLGGGVEGVEVSLWPPDLAAEDAPAATTKTNDYGDFKITHDQALTGKYEVVFKKEGYAEVRRTVELSPEDEWPPFIDLSLPGAITIRGLVTDKLKESPAPGADVRLTVLGRTWKGKTGEDGLFEIEKVVPGRGRIVVDSEGYARAEVEVPNTHKAEPLSIQLSPERIVELEVVDADGRAVAKATIECLDEEHGDYRSLVSGEDGKSVLRGARLDATELAIRVTHPDYVSDSGFDRFLDLPADQERSHHRLVLQSAGTVTGRVTEAESERPLQGVRVSVGSGASGSARAWTGFEGEYSIAGARPGETIVTTYLNGYAPQLKQITVASDEDTVVNFELGPAHQAGGIVVNQDDEPIAQAHVFASQWRGHAALGAQALTGADGRFALDNLPEDEFKVSVQAAGYRSMTGIPIAPSKMDHRIELASSALPGGTTSKLKIGRPFPELELTTLKGRPVKTSSLRGKTVLVEFWATWCGPCLAEVPALKALHAEYGSREDFAMIGISIDSDADEKKLKRTIRDKEIGWTQVFGSKGGATKAAEACGVEFIPQVFLIDREGNLAAKDLSGEALRKRIAALLSRSAEGDKPDTSGGEKD